MQEAGFITFIRTIGILLLVIYGMKFIAKYVLPLVLTRAVKKAQERAQERNNTYQEPSSNVNVGETSIDKKPSQSTTSKSNDVGDYIDYEEVE